jgi:hypothetical protein
MVFAAMQDGRFFTDYNPDCSINKKIKSQFGITDDHEYRLFLQRNGTKILDQQIGLTCDCPKCLALSRKKFLM